MKRTYECRAKISKGFTVRSTVKVTFDKDEKIKDVEQGIKEHIAKNLTKGSFSFSAEDIKLKRIA